MKPNSQLFKGSLTTIVMKLLSEQEKMYGYEITRKVKEITDGKLVLTEGALYPALHKLEAEGHVTVSVEMVGNRSRKYYSLTKTGQTEASNKLAELQSFLNDMQAVLNIRLTTN